MVLHHEAQTEPADLGIDTDLASLYLKKDDVKPRRRDHKPRYKPRAPPPLKEKKLFVLDSYVTAVSAMVAFIIFVTCFLRGRRRRQSKRFNASKKEHNRWDPKAGGAPSWTTTALPPTVKRACQRGDSEAVLQWLSSAGDVDARDNQARTALFYAAASGHVDLARALLENRASPDLRDLNGQTPLHAAAHAGSASAVRLLLDAGADVSLQDKTDGKTPLALAKAAGNHGCARLIQRRERAISRGNATSGGTHAYQRHAPTQQEDAV